MGAVFHMKYLLIIDSYSLETRLMGYFGVSLLFILGSPETNPKTGFMGKEERDPRRNW